MHDSSVLGVTMEMLDTLSFDHINQGDHRWIPNIW